VAVTAVVSIRPKIFPISAHLWSTRSRSHADH